MKNKNLLMAILYFLIGVGLVYFIKDIIMALIGGLILIIIIEKFFRKG